MNKRIALLTLLVLSPFANAQMPMESQLDKVTFQISAKQWVTTQTALLTVTIHVTLSNTDMVKVRDDIMSNLNKIAKGDWQITSFDRSQDSSGLEKLFVAAQTRIAQTELKNIYQGAKNVSKPGATYEINGIEFKPSLEETQQVKSQLRDKLYQQVNEEIGRLNKVFTNQKYSLNDIVFYASDEELPAAKTYQARAMNAMVEKVGASAAPAPAVSVSNELIMGALVELASNRQGDNPGANH